jgi:hypothetical protein
MTKLLVLFLLILSTLKGVTQPSNKIYYGSTKDEFIEFINETEINFLIHDDGCLGGMFYSGKGLFQLKNGVLKIKVQDHDKSLESTCILTKDSIINSGFIIKGKVISEKGDLLPGVIFSYYVGKKIYGFMADDKGTFYQTINASPISGIKVTFVGYRICNITVKDNSLIECQVVMKEPYYDFLDNQTIKVNITLDDKTKRFIASQIKIKK